MNTLRCFIAIDLSPDVRRSLAALSKRLQSQRGEECIRWVQPESIHLTLEFLGELPAGRVAEVAGMLDQIAASHSAFTLRVAGLGCFPDGRRPRVVWVGLEEPTGSLVKLQADVRRGCVGLGLQVDDRPYSPHLTLGRVRREAGTEAAVFARDILADVESLAIGEMTADGVHLIRSDLQSTGAVYSRLHSAALAARHT